MLQVDQIVHGKEMMSQSRGSRKDVNRCKTTHVGVTSQNEDNVRQV
jgi:hypothetical protein